MCTKRVFPILSFSGAPQFKLKGKVVSGSAAPEELQFPKFLGVDSSQLLSLNYSTSSETKCPVFVRQVAQDRLGLSGHTISTILKEHDIDCMRVPFIDGHLEKEIDKNLQTGKAVAFGISTTFICTEKELHQQISAGRRALPGLPIVLGGAGVTLNPKWFAASDAEYAILGDAENSLPRLLKALSEDSAIHDIPNLAWRENEVAKLPTSREDVDINEYPLPDPAILDGKTAPVVTYESSRGCRFCCKFCSYPRQSPSFRTKSPERICSDFLSYSSHGVRTIFVVDSTMLTPPRRMRHLCRLLIEAGAPVTWICSGHSSQLQDEEFIRMMRMAGCRSISVGVESGSDRQLSLMNKKTTAAKNLKALKLLSMNEIVPLASLFVGFPGEDADSIADTKRLIIEAAPTAYSLQTFQVRDLQAPVVQEAETFGLSFVFDADGNVESWSHSTMNNVEAGLWERRLHYELAHALPHSFLHPLLRFSEPMIRIPLAEDFFPFFASKVVPIVKEWELAHLHHPGSPFVYEKGDLSKFEHHRQRARVMFDRLCEELISTGKGR